MSTELTPIPYQEVEKMANAVAVSQLFGVKTKEQAIVLLLLAQAEGLHPMIAARDYDIIQNKPAKKSEAMMRSFQNSGGSVEWIELTDTVAKAKFIPPTGSPLVMEWTIERAKKAGLLDKNGSMYLKYPRRMLSARCISEGIKTVWPSATSGLLSTEEAMDVEAEVKPTAGKSRVEAIASQAKDAVEDAVVSPVKQGPEPAPKAEKPAKKAKDESTQGKATTTEPAPLKVQGIVEEPPKSGTVEGKGLKYSFKIQDKFYGTFDKELVTKIMECVDKRILIEFTYTERQNADKTKTFQDIVSFRQVTGDEVEIPI